MPLSQKKLTQIRQKLEASPAFEEVSQLMNLASGSTRLRILYLIESREFCVGDLAEILGLKFSAVSQQLTKLRGYRLVSARRQAQTIFYGLTDHPFNAKLREIFFRQFRVQRGG